MIESIAIPTGHWTRRQENFVPVYSTKMDTHYLPYNKSILSGEEYTRLEELQKGDRIKALPWKYELIAFDNHLLSYTSHSDKIDTWDGNPFQNTYDHHVKMYLNTTFTDVTHAELYGAPSVPSTQKQMVDSMAILKAQASLRKQVASLPMLFLERKATVKTLQKYSKFILNNAITMQRKDVKKWLKALKRKSSRERLKTLATQIANSHLEFVFGVLPVIDDMVGLIDHFSQPRLDVRTGRGRHRTVSESESSKNFSSNHFTGKYIKVVKSQYSTRTDLRCNIVSRVANDASLLGFNPAYVFYDNTPLSFILGWFSNFNTWLQALDPLIGLEYHTGSSSKMMEREVQVTCVSNGPKAPTVVRDLTINHFVDSFPKEQNYGSLIQFERVVHPTMPDLQNLRLMDKTSLYTHLASLSLTVQRLVRTAETEVKVKPFRYRGKRIRNLPPIRYRKVS